MCPGDEAGKCATAPADTPRGSKAGLGSKLEIPGHGSWKLLEKVAAVTFRMWNNLEQADLAGRVLDFVDVRVLPWH